MSETISLLGYRVYSQSIKSIKLNSLKGNWVINTINPHSYNIAKKDQLFSLALHESNILLPDGSGIVLAARLIRNLKIPKIAGSDIHIHLLKEINKIGGKVFYLGASYEALKKITERIKRDYPAIKVMTYSPPFTTEFSRIENLKMITKVNGFEPDVLFVGMTAPKQEKWVQMNKLSLNVGIICSIGAVFDFYAGTKKRSNKIWIKLGLEWLPRLIREPRRMWKRNFISTPLFLIDVIIAMIFKDRNPD